MLILYTRKGVAPEVNLRERIYHVRLHQVRIRQDLIVMPLG